MPTTKPPSLRAFVHLLPVLIPDGAMTGATAIVVDVLRATTAMTHALASGCEAILPCLEVHEAWDVASRLPSGSAVLGGERQGLPIDGFALGNSPSSYSPEVCRDKTVVMTTTNGTRAILACRGAHRAFIGSFPNVSATIRAATGVGSNAIHVVCSGTNGAISFEDTLLAGFMIDALHRLGVTPENDSALIAQRAWSAVGSDANSPPSLAGVLSLGIGGRRVREIGLSADIEDAARIDRFDFAAEWLREPSRIVKLS